MSKLKKFVYKMPLIFSLLMMNTLLYSEDFTFNVPINVSDFNELSAIKLSCLVSANSDINNSNSYIGMGSKRINLSNGALNTTAVVAFNASTGYEASDAHYYQCQLLFCKHASNTCYKANSYYRSSIYRTLQNAEFNDVSSASF